MTGPVFASTLDIAARLGRLEPAGPFRAIRWPHNPWYWGGHALVLDRAPADDAREDLERAFCRWFPEAAHVTLMWPGEGAPRWEGAGYEVQPSLGMRAQSPAARALPPGLEAGPLRADDEPAWQAVAAIRREVLELPEGTRFLPLAIADARRIAQSPWGAWVGLRRDGALLADLGLVETPWGVRLQEVQVRADRRGQGLGRALLGAAIREAAARWPGRPLLLEVDTDNEPALALYRGAGFQEIERLGSAQRAPAEGSG
jgi:ribosomal protein S18 acetylase RimI-like enzyme